VENGGCETANEGKTRREKERERERESTCKHEESRKLPTRLRVMTLGKTRIERGQSLSSHLRVTRKYLVMFSEGERSNESERIE